jgi:hypothetical protein
MATIGTTGGWTALRAVLVVGAVLVVASCGGNGTSAVTTAPGPTATTGPDATGPTTFRDPVGDVSGGAGPDLVSVTIGHTPADVTFGIRFAEAPPLRASTSEGWIDMVLVGIDVPPYGPPPGPIGGWTGVDYVAGLHGAQREIRFQAMEGSTEGADQPTGTASAEPDAPERVVRLDATVDGATLRFAIPRRLLGDPASFAFTVAAGREGETGGGGSDSAPDLGALHYEIAG